MRSLTYLRYRGCLNRRWTWTTMVFCILSETTVPVRTRRWRCTSVVCSWVSFMALCLLSGDAELTLAGDRLDPGDVAADLAELGGVGGALGRLQHAKADPLVAGLGPARGGARGRS